MRKVKGRTSPLREFKVPCFDSKTGEISLKVVAYFREFEYAIGTQRHTFVIHMSTQYPDMARLSHKESGYGVAQLHHDTTAEQVLEAKAWLNNKLETVGAAKILGAIKDATQAMVRYEADGVRVDPLNSV